jgi:hypothetical protein
MSGPPAGTIRYYAALAERRQSRIPQRDDLTARYHNHLRRNVPRAVLRSARMASVQRFAELTEHVR